MTYITKLIKISFFKYVVPTIAIKKESKKTMLLQEKNYAKKEKKEIEQCHQQQQLKAIIFKKDINKRKMVVKLKIIIQNCLILKTIK